MSVYAATAVPQLYGPQQLEPTRHLHPPQEHPERRGKSASQTATAGLGPTKEPAVHRGGGKPEQWVVSATRTRQTDELDSVEVKEHLKD